MTRTKNYKRFEIGKEIYFREQYRDKGMETWLWQYGYIVKDTHILLKRGLSSRPNINRLFSK